MPRFDFFRNAARLPALIIINGCYTLAERPDGRVLKIHEAFQIKDGVKGRAYIGFNVTVAGLRGDEYFRVFFAHWTRTTTGKYLTLTQAKDAAIKTFENLPSWDSVQRQPFTLRTDKEIGEKLIIKGDPNLTFD